MSEAHDLIEFQLQSGGVVDELATSSLCQCCAPRVAHFGDVTAELDAARTSCALFDLSDRVQLELTGKDAAAFLHKFCTNHIQRLAPGQGCEAFLTNIKGRILGHVFAFRTQDAVCLDSPPTDEQQLVAHFEHYLFSEDVQFHGRTSTWGDLLVAGPDAASRLAGVGINAAPLALLQHTLQRCDDLHIATRRVPFWNQPCYLLSVDRSQLVRLWQQLTGAGIPPAGACAFHALRIEAAFPLCGLDIGPDNLAQEAHRTPHAISFSKGCYLGQEPIARIDALGHVNRHLTRLQVETSQSLPRLVEVTDDDGTAVGQITSSIRVPGTPHTIALAMIRTSHCTAGTRLLVQHAAQPCPATVIGQDN